MNESCPKCGEYHNRCFELKELSGVEIIGMSGKYDFTYEVDIIDFVRACLKKRKKND